MIRRVFGTAIFLLLCAGLSFGQTPPLKLCLVGNTVTLMWDPNPEGDLAGYKLYQGVASGVYTEPPTVLQKVTTYTVTGLAPGTYFYVLTAYNTAGDESGYSNEVSTSIPINVGPQGPPGPQGPAGTAPPEISPRITALLVAEITKTTAIIAWATDVECSGLVEYGPSPSLGKSMQANNLGTTDHMVQLSGLTARLHYYYRVSGTCGTAPVTSTIRTFNSK
jgi:hypothetical protein